MEVTEVPYTADTNSRVLDSQGEPNTGRNRRNDRYRTSTAADRPSVDQKPYHKPPRGIVNTPSAPGSSIPASEAQAITDTGNSSSPQKRNPRNRRHRLPNAKDASTLSTSGPEKSNNNGPPSDKSRPSGGGFKRGAKFNAALTEPDSTHSSVPQPAGKHKSTGKHKHTLDPETLDDLTSRLTYALRTSPYPDCPICFSPIHPTQHTWSCSPSIPVIRSDDVESDEQQYCWTTFHVKCIGSWATRSVKTIADAWRARGEEARKGEWRCPGCQAKREIVPSGYWCFCNSTPDPKPPRLATPHSCGNPCSRVRESGCGHQCPLACHPGPCPPCQITTQLQCYCPGKNVLAFRCGEGRGTKGRGRDLSCGSACGRLLACGKHACEKVCHSGNCGSCAIREVVKCWCGKEEKEIGCGEGDAKVCLVENEGEWIGRFGCLDVCGRLFDCGTHKCQQRCHPPSHRPAHCPRSPSKTTRCPCGKRRVASSSAIDTDPTAFPPRSHCTSPIPTCTSSCDKLHLNCGHPCVATCHIGPCPPCSVSIVRPCRCGATTTAVRCYELHPSDGDGGDNPPEVTEILCDKPCTVLRACGRHQCRRLCCPLASLASAAGKKGKKRANGSEQGVGEEQGGLHECDLICGKILSCGSHRCEEKDHKSSICPPCLRSSFEEMVCYCGRTILEPPIPCGTQIRCDYQCPRPPPCGHPAIEHSCHEEESPCPLCPSLEVKKCACGKKMMGNVRCSLENNKVSCGTICGKLMTCGFHHCERLCHGDICGPCTASCGKSRKLCLPAQHPCTHACHAPSTCPEDNPCQSLLTLTCSCGRIRQAVHCGRSSSNSAGAQRAPPKCTNECSIAKRNAKLADALGITPESREKVSAVSYHEELVAFAKSNYKFLGVVEKALAELVNSDKKTQVLPHMPPERRKFVHDLAVVYRMDTQMVDQEPHRSVRLSRRLDTRIPTPLLSSTIASPSAAPPSLGKLVEMRGSAAASSWRSGSTPSFSKSSTVAPASGPTRGWSTAVTRPTSAATTSKPVAPPVPGGSVRPPSANISRTSTPTPVQISHNQSEAVNVPDNWEDDV